MYILRSFAVVCVGIFFSPNLHFQTEPDILVFKEKNPDLLDISV